MKRRPARWIPEPGQLASYTGGSSRLLKGGKLLRVVAEASTERMIVEAIGNNGKPVRFTVLTKNLGRPQPQLFE